MMVLKVNSDCLGTSMYVNSDCLGTTFTLERLIQRIKIIIIKIDNRLVHKIITDNGHLTNTPPSVCKN